MTIDNQLNVKKYECPICHKTFKNSHSLASHKYTYHRHKENNENNINSDINNDKKETENNFIDNDTVKEIINDTDKENPSINETVEDNKITIGEHEFSQEDLNKIKEDYENQSIDSELQNQANQIEQMISNMSEDDATELYYLMIEGIGDLSGVDVENELPDLYKKAPKRGKHLAYVINKYYPSLSNYIIPILAIGGIAIDIYSIYKYAKAKKMIEKMKNKNENDKKESDKI